MPLRYPCRGTCWRRKTCFFHGDFFRPVRWAFATQITIKNLQRVSKELGENLGDRELEAMIDEFDKNLDGSISLDEFVVRS